MSRSEPLSQRPAPTVEETHRIADMKDAVVRNLRITQAYHDLKIGLSRVLGSENVSWCAYATWASKTAGRFIRGEHLPRAVSEIADRIPALQRVISRSGLRSVVADVHAEICAHVAEGNHLVFAEMAPLYAEWIARFDRGGGRIDASELRSFLRQLAPGPVERGGQDKLVEAFTCYHQAMTARDAKARAELILLANLLVGHHEQTRLQGPIEGAMNAPLLHSPLRGLAGGDADRRGGGPAVPRVLAPFFGRLSREIEGRWRELLTRELMTLELPSVSLCLGEDLPPWSVRREFPDDLRRVGHPRLVALLAELDLTPDTVVGSGARDWASLRDRMNFVVDFFRTRQQDHLLYERPFTRMQAVAIAEDRIPHGAL